MNEKQFVLWKTHLWTIEEIHPIIPIVLLKHKYGALHWIYLKELK